MTSKIILTPQGVLKLNNELTNLKKVRRVEIAERIRLAKEFGDLSENAEYHEAKDEQAFIEGRILEIEQMLKMADIVDKKKDTNISVGSIVDLNSKNEIKTFEIVGTTEAEPLAGKISIDSPLAQALIGKSAGDQVTLEAPSGTRSYTIKSVR